MSKNLTKNKDSVIIGGWKQVERLQETRVLTFCGMMAAMSIVLSQVATIKAGPFIRIGFSGIPNQIVDYLFGPWLGALFAAVMDILNLILSGEASNFMPGITFTAMLSAVIYGLFLYKKPVRLWRIAVSQLIVKVVCNICLNTFFLNVLYGTATKAIFISRIITNAGKYVVDVPLMYFLYLFINKAIRPYFDENR